MMVVPCQTPLGVFRVRTVVCDLDRTLTDASLRVVPAALRELRRLRRRRVRTILATGRTWKELARRTSLLSAFDDLILEGGGLVGTRRRLRPLLSPGPSLRALARHLDVRGIPVHRGMTSLSVDRGHRRTLMGAPMIRGFNVRPNRDRLDVTLKGVDKGAALRRLQRHRKARRSVFVFADGENDVSLFDAADYAVAVRNAVPVLRRRAHEVTQEYGGQGVARFVRERLLANGAPP